MHQAMCLVVMNLPRSARSWCLNSNLKKTPLQGACGQFTHYYSATLHAIDLECPVGTPVLSVADGTVISVKDESLVGGIHVQVSPKSLNPRP